MNKSFLLLALAFAAGGCARTMPMVVSTDHPASPDAAVAPLLPPSTTLALAHPATTAPAPASQPVHGGHDTGRVGHDSHGAHAPQSVAPAASPVSAVYFCPHHLEVVSDKPGKCPKCSMNLARKRGGR